MQRDIEGNDSLNGRNVLITGANTGIGRETAMELAKRGATVVLACRSEDKTRPVIDEIRAATKGARAEFVPLDLGSLASVRKCADLVEARGEPLHVLINNAGLAGTRGLTSDGFEQTFGVNHLGHFLLTQRLLGALERGAADAAPARIVNVASKAHYDCPGIDWDAPRRSTATVTGLREYAVSKLCNVLFTKELARRHGNGRVHAYALHPGVIASDVWRHVPWPIRPLMTSFMKSSREGATASLACATSPSHAKETGRYYDEDGSEKAPSALAEDVSLARELWARSEAWTSP